MRPQEEMDIRRLASKQVKLLKFKQKKVSQFWLTIRFGEGGMSRDYMQLEDVSLSFLLFGRLATMSL